MSAEGTDDFLISPQTHTLLAKLDDFIEKVVKPIENEGDNIRFLDHRREASRTDWNNDGLPNKEWEALLHRVVKLADEAGFWKLPMPKDMGGSELSNLDMAIVRERFAAKGLGLHNDLQNEHSIIGNMPLAVLVNARGTPEQRREIVPKLLSGEWWLAFGLTEPGHGSDATHMETRAVRDGDDWIINGEKMWNTGVHIATHDLVIARTSGKNGDGTGLTAFFTPMNSPGVKIEEYYWTFNMPTDHARVSFKNVRVPNSAIIGGEGGGLASAGIFLNENRIRQAASSLGAAVYCIRESVKYANKRVLFGKPISVNQAVQWPLVDLATEAEMLRLLIRETARQMDGMTRDEVTQKLSHRVSMCNYRANILVGKAADQAIQVHGGMGYSRHYPFEHIYRHHRRYRITEGSEQIQIRNVAKGLFGFGSGMGSSKKSKL